MIKTFCKGMMYAVFGIIFLILINGFVLGANTFVANQNNVINGTTVIAPDGNAKVGIGTNNPDRTLSVNGNANVSGNLYVNSTNVGIGTSNPAKMFQIQTGTNKGIGINISGNVTGIFTDANYSIPGSSIEFQRPTDGVFDSFIINYISSGSPTKSVLGIYGREQIVLGSNSVERMRITDTGNVGIGTITPQAVLHVGNGTESSLSTNGGLLKVMSYGPQAGPNALGGIELPSTSTGYGTKLYTNNADDTFGIATRYNTPTWTPQIVLKEQTGYVGIGTSNPQSMLQVGYVGPGHNYIGVNSKFASGIGAFNGSAAIQMYTDGSTTAISSNNNATGSIPLTISAGDLTLTAALGHLQFTYMNSNTSVASRLVWDSSQSRVYIESSSIRYKQNIRNLTYGLSDVMKLTPRDFEWKADNKSAIGFIAEEVYQVIPEVIYYNKNGTIEGLDYEKLTPVLTKGIQEQQQQIQLQQSKIENLTEENKILKVENLQKDLEISAIKQTLCDMGRIEWC